MDKGVCLSFLLLVFILFFKKIVKLVCYIYVHPYLQKFIFPKIIKGEINSLRVRKYMYRMQCLQECRAWFFFYMFFSKNCTSWKHIFSSFFSLCHRSSLQSLWNETLISVQAILTRRLSSACDRPICISSSPLRLPRNRFLVGLFSPIKSNIKPGFAIICRQELLLALKWLAYLITQSLGNQLEDFKATF